MAALTGEALELARAEAQEHYRQLRSRKAKLDEDSIELILSGARSHYAWRSDPVSEETLQALYAITASGATSMNTCPARFVFVTSDEGKARLAKSLKEANVRRTLKIPLFETRACRAPIL